MKRMILLITIATTTAAHAVSSPYQYEQYDTVRYAKQTRAQARELDRLADAAAKYDRDNRRAMEAAQRQELSFSQLRHREESLAQGKVFIKEYPTYKYDIAVSEAATEIRMVK